MASGPYGWGKLNGLLSGVGGSWAKGTFSLLPLEELWIWGIQPAAVVGVGEC